MTHTVLVDEQSTAVIVTDAPTDVDTALTNVTVQTATTPVTVETSPMVTYATGGEGGTAPSAYALASAASAGATSIVVDRPPDGILAGGSFVAVGALTTKCEIRRVTAQSGDNLTITPALTYDHAEEEHVWVTEDTWITPEWFGCKANDATFDSGPGLMQANINMALTGVFGITGHNSRYYTSFPLSFPDGSMVEDIALTAQSAFAIDPLIGERNGIPDQFFAMIAGQFGTVTGVDTGTDEITLSTSAGSQVGDRVVFYARQGDALQHLLRPDVPITSRRSWGSCTRSRSTATERPSISRPRARARSTSTPWARRA